MRATVLLTLALVSVCPAFPLRLEPLPEAAARPASGAALDVAGLTELALVFSGTAEADLARYERKLDQWSAEFRARSTGWDETRKAEGLLLFLHEKWKDYSTYQTRLDTLLDQGTFNCVSSALAYMILGRAAGLDVQAAATTDHAFALVHLSTRDVDVETTTKYGFDPGAKTEFTDSFGRTGFVYVPPGNYSQRRNIGDRQLLGLLIQNRMADFQRAGDAESEVGPAIDRWTVEGTPEAKATLVSGFLNYASWLNDHRRYLDGLDLVGKMAAWTGPVDAVGTLEWTFVNNQMNTLLTAQDFEGARALFAAEDGKHLLNDQRRQDLLSQLYAMQVQNVAAAQGPRAAVMFLQGLPPEIAALPSLTRALSVYTYNWSVEVHNEFARLWNAGKRDEARSTLRDALTAIPDSELLKKDSAVSQRD